MAVPANSCVIFDRRTLHASSPNTAGGTAAGTERRVVFYGFAAGSGQGWPQLYRAGQSRARDRYLRCGFLYGALLLSAISGLDFLGCALSRPQVRLPLAALEGRDGR